jgi:tRNA pseudouridine38-40 synthase
VKMVASRIAVPLRAHFARFRIGVSYNGLAFNGWISHNNNFAFDDRSSIKGERDGEEEGREREEIKGKKPVDYSHAVNVNRSNNNNNNNYNTIKSNIGIGSNYSNSAASSKPSVIGVLHAATERFMGVGNFENLRGSSRTDAGVHAIRNCFQVDVCGDMKLNAKSLVGGINDNLFKLDLLDVIGISDAKVVDESFDARRDALARTYMYRIVNKNYRDNFSKVSILQGQNALVRYGHMNLDLMREAAKLLIGELDFSSFRSTMCQASTPIRTIYSIDIISNKSPLHNQDALSKEQLNSMLLLQGDDEIISIFVKGNKFLHRMVRMIVATLVDVGIGKLSIEDFR